MKFHLKPYVAQILDASQRIHNHTPLGSEAAEALGVVLVMGVPDTVYFGASISGWYWRQVQESS